MIVFPVKQYSDFWDTSPLDISMFYTQRLRSKLSTTEARCLDKLHNKFELDRFTNRRVRSRQSSSVLVLQKERP